MGNANQVLSQLPLAHGCCTSSECGSAAAGQADDLAPPHAPEKSMFLNGADGLPTDGVRAGQEMIEWGRPLQAHRLRKKQDCNSHSDAGTSSEVKKQTNGTREKLLASARRDDAPGVLQQVAHGADINDMAEALRLAAHRGCASVVRELVAVGLFVNDACPHTGFTPLQLSVAGGHLAVCELLLDALADVHASAGGSATAITLAHKLGHTDVEEALERHAASLMIEQNGNLQEESPAWSRRAHVLPRVSPTLSEVMLQAVPTPPVRATPRSSKTPAIGGPNAGGYEASSNGRPQRIRIQRRSLDEPDDFVPTSSMAKSTSVCTPATIAEMTPKSIEAQMFNKPEPQGGFREASQPGEGEEDEAMLAEAAANDVAADPDAVIGPA